MKFLTAGVLVTCGALAADAPPALTLDLTVADVNDDIPAPCPQVKAPVELAVLEECYANLEGYTGPVTYAGTATTGVWPGNPCVTTGGDPVATYFSVDSLGQYLPAWMGLGEALGKYVLTLETATTKECTISFLTPTSPDAECAGALEGTPVGTPITVPAGATTFEVVALTFAPSPRIVATSACLPDEVGKSVVSIDASPVLLSFNYMRQESTPTTNPGGESAPASDVAPGSPEGVSAHLMIGSLFVLPLLATW
eukprot:Gregarina_sp_Pseudo_9__1165@NODE_1768_length_1342_cov_518_747506_g1638_i0_p1_GENE_NODE_1768_length_1342_cov_518_747506_g1638_i0NODE_1768_length_1342_cov_518_747506_g1638_i0_p1_ORF_typecomplete_len254_score48_81_NODE_1768_length_1342_cov_518_747506_g1638_i04741235